MSNRTIEYFYKSKLEAFCEGLGMNNIEKLLTGSIADFYKIGSTMQKRINDKIGENR